MFPGQGAQYPGMGKDFFSEYLEAKEVFQEADHFLDSNFSKMMFEADQNTLNQTQNAQLALYIHSIALLKVIEKNFPHLKPDCTLGLSLGEYSAIMAAKKMGFLPGLKLVQARGNLMQAASKKKIGTMAAVLPATEELVKEVILPFQKQGYEVFIANLNSPGQVVIAGDKNAIDHVTPALKEKGCKRVIFLEVSGAFHTPFMESAQIGLKEVIDSTPFSTSSIDLIMNVSGQKMENEKQLKENLIKQVVSVVYWQKSIETALRDEPYVFIEIGAGKTLTNMNKKMHQVPSISIETVADLPLLAGL